jgi:hypothetical protein
MKNKLYLYAALAVAAILILLSSCGESTTLYQRIVIDTYPYSAIAAVTDTTLGFYDESGNGLDTDDNSGDYPPSARIDYTGGLEPGIYYIKIYSASFNPGPYVIRVLSLDIGESLPAPVFPGVANFEGADGDDADIGNVPVSPNDISLGNSNWLNKDIDVGGIGDDVDWLKLVLP